tara:strand:+ start:112 stop:837 length:726 start_codon:yes stop_codon:yes gene_type:complete
MYTAAFVDPELRGDLSYSQITLPTQLVYCHRHNIEHIVLDRFDPKFEQALETHSIDVGRERKKKKRIWFNKLQAFEKFLASDADAMCLIDLDAYCIAQSPNIFDDHSRGVWIMEESNTEYARQFPQRWEDAFDMPFPALNPSYTNIGVATFDRQSVEFLMPFIMPPYTVDWFTEQDLMMWACWKARIQIQPLDISWNAPINPVKNGKIDDAKILHPRGGMHHERKSTRTAFLDHICQTSII